MDRTSSKYQLSRQRPTPLGRLAKRLLKGVALFYFGGLIIKWYSSRPKRREPAIFAANHVSFLDSFLLALALKGPPITFLAKADLFKGRFGKLFDALGQIPIDRRGGKAAQQALEVAKKTVLWCRRWLGIFPEGGTPRCGKQHTHRGTTGTARLALSTPGVRLYAVGILGSERALPKGRRFPRLCKVRFKIREIDLEPFRKLALTNEPEAVRQLTQLLMETIAELSGRPLVDLSYEECLPDGKRSKKAG